MAEEVDLSVILQSLSTEFDTRTEQRHQMGAEKYGMTTFLTIDSLEGAIEEVLDLANYARYTFIRLRLLQEKLDTTKVANKPLPGKEQVGKGNLSGQGFVKGGIPDENGTDPA